MFFYNICIFNHIFIHTTCVIGGYTIIMKFSEMLIGFGFGAAIGIIGGALLMNNSRKVRVKVAECQEAFVDRVEAKKREIAESKIAKKALDIKDNAMEVVDKIKGKNL